MNILKKNIDRWKLIKKNHKNIRKNSKNDNIYIYKYFLFKNVNNLYFSCI